MEPTREYEEEDLEELIKFCASVTFSDGKHLDPKELALEEIVYVPKIGSRIDFEKQKRSTQKSTNSQGEKERGRSVLSELALSHVTRRPGVYGIYEL